MIYLEQIIQLGLTSAADVNSSDVVYVMSSDGAGSYTSYYYQTDPFGGFLGGDGWRILGNSILLICVWVTIAPDDGVIVKRISAGEILVVLYLVQYQYKSPQN